jgi:uncharacterized membrane protein
MCVEGREPLAPISSRMAGMIDWIEAGGAIHAGGGTVAGLEKGGLVVIILVSVVAIVAFVWIFRETGRRD